MRTWQWSTVGVTVVTVDRVSGVASRRGIIRATPVVHRLRVHPALKVSPVCNQLYVITLGNNSRRSSKHLEGSLRRLDRCISWSVSSMSSTQDATPSSSCHNVAVNLCVCSCSCRFCMNCNCSRWAHDAITMSGPVALTQIL